MPLLCETGTLAEYVPSTENPWDFITHYIYIEEWGLAQRQMVFRQH